MKAKATIWNSTKRENEIIDVEILHWGISYEELRDGVGQYTVVFVKLPDGSVKEVHPTLLKFESNE